MRLASLNAAFIVLFLNMPLFYFQSAYADGDFLGDTGPVGIEEIGCFSYEATCFVTLKYEYGPEACRKSSLWWDQSSIGGEAVVSILTSARATGRKVVFHISKNCYLDHPTFEYVVLN